MADGPFDYITPLVQGRALVPDWAQEELRQKLGMAQIAQSAAQVRALEVEGQEKQRALARSTAFEDDIRAIGAAPDANGIASLMTRYPEFADKLKQGWDVRDKAAKDADVRQMGGLFGYLQAGRPQDAAKMLRRRIEADKAAGRDTSEDEELAGALESGDLAQIKQAQTVIGMHLAAATGPDHFATTYGALTKDGKPEYRNVEAGGSIISIDPATGQARTVYESPYIKGPDGQLYQRPEGGDLSSGGAGAIPFDRLIDAESRGQQFDGTGRPLTSPKGAIGIAQVMPATGPEAARLAGVEWNAKRFRTDAAYNRLLGEAYYNKHRADFGNDALAAAAYNAGPGRVRAALAKGGPSGWLRHVPKETQDYVLKVSGGAVRTAAATGLTPVFPEKPKPTRMTPEEVRAEGLDLNVVYYRDTNGVPQAVSGQTKQDTGGKGKPLPANVQEKIEAQVGIRDTLSRLTSAFKPDYSGIGSSIENIVQGVVNVGTPGQRDWWADFYAMDNSVRNDLFGAALTASEQAAYEKTTISPRMDAKQIRTNLGRRSSIIKGALARRQRVLRANGYIPEAVDEMFGEPGGSPAPSSQGLGGFRILRVRPK